MSHLAASAAASQLEWVLDALDGAALTDDQVAGRFTGSFLSLFPPQRWIEMMTQQSPALRPFKVTAVEVRGDRARAELTTPLGPMTMSCSVDGAGTIDVLAITPSDGRGLTPRLPMEFPAANSGSGVGLCLVVVAGVPGTGKSTLADRLGTTLGIPVFATDWMLGALTPFGGRAFDRLLDIGEELLTTLAYRQLSLGQSAILDAPTESPATRTRWMSLATHLGAAHAPILCRCDDDVIHQQRLTTRSRGIPGWHEGGDWDNVRRRRDALPPWEGEHLELDATNSVDENLAEAIAWIRSR